MKKLAFIIEDDFDAAIIFSSALEANGLTTETIRRGDEALTRLKETTPDVILLDLHLPNVKGTDILEMIRSDERLRPVKVVIVTADPRMAETVREKADLILLKPTTYSQVRDFTARILKSGTGHLKTSK